MSWLWHHEGQSISHSLHLVDKQLVIWWRFQKMSRRVMDRWGRSSVWSRFEVKRDWCVWLGNHEVFRALSVTDSFDCRVVRMWMRLCETGKGRRNGRGLPAKWKWHPKTPFFKRLWDCNYAPQNGYSFAQVKFAKKSAAMMACLLTNII